MGTDSLQYLVLVLVVHDLGKGTETFLGSDPILVKIYRKYIFTHGEFETVIKEKQQVELDRRTSNDIRKTEIKNNKYPMSSTL